jgi:hypothetical protein
MEIRPWWIRWGAALGALLALTPLLSGCVASTPPGSTATPGRPLSLTTRAASVAVPSNGAGTRVAVYCLPGEQMIGGGYLATDTFEYDASIAASYPSSASQWTAIAGPGAAFTLTVFVYCVVSGPALGVQVVQTRASVAACPARGVELGAGFDTSGASYAVCARQNARLGANPLPITFNPRSSQHSYAPASVTLTCPMNLIAVGGSLEQADRMIGSASAGPPYNGWSFTLGGDGDAQLAVRCVVLSPS